MNNVLLTLEGGLVDMDGASMIYRLNYKKSDTLNKIKLKCWFYYCECMQSGGRLAIPFTEYKKVMTCTNYMEMVKGYLVDCTDIGGQERALRVLSRHYL